MAFAKAIATLHLEDVEKVFCIIPTKSRTHMIHYATEAKDPPGLTLNGIQKANLAAGLHRLLSPIFKI